jgi:hypothetical protein
VDDYEERINKFADDEQARNLLKMVHTAAGLYFAYLADHDIQVGSLFIHRNVPASDGPPIHKHINVDDLYAGGRLLSEH